MSRKSNGFGIPPKSSGGIVWDERQNNGNTINTNTGFCRK